jgi:AraC-like DNA-binding protein
MSRATLARQLRSLEAPPARVLLLWGRLLHAAGLLDRGRTIEAAALGSGYASGSGLHRAFQRHVGLPPSDAPVRGSVALVLDALLESAEIRQFRSRPGSGRLV